MGFWAIVAIGLGACGLLGILMGTPLYYVYKKRMIDLEKSKLIEEHRTNNLALAYQILSTRPEVSMDEVMMLVDLNDKNQIQGPIK